MKIKVFSISDSDKHFQSAIQEYQKRLGKSVEIFDIKPEKNGTREQIISKDTQKIIDRLEKSSGYKIMLSKEGKSYDTLQFTDILKNNLDIIFIIGGPYGLDEPNLDKYIDMKISFGKMTFPHGLAKLMILEQIYRGDSILKGREYHY